MSHPLPTTAQRPQAAAAPASTEPRPFGWARGSLLAWVALLLVGLAALDAGSVVYLTGAGRPGMDDGSGMTLAGTAYTLHEFGLPWARLLLLIGAMGLLAVAGVPAARRMWRQAAVLALAAALLFAGWEGLGRLRGPLESLRISRIRQATVALTPLAEALARFTREHGRPPRGMSELVPAYLPAGHPTGIRGCSAPDLSRGSLLEMDCPNGFMTLDRLVYDPHGWHPQGSAWERMGAWAYLHD